MFFCLWQPLAFTVCWTAVCHKRCRGAARARRCAAAGQLCLRSACSTSEDSNGQFLLQDRTAKLYSQHGRTGPAWLLCCSSSGLRSQQAISVALPFSLLLYYGASKLQLL